MRAKITAPTPVPAGGVFGITSHHGFVSTAIPAKDRETIIVTATFTAEPVAESLQFWTKKLGLETEIRFAPFNQVYQQLLDSSSMLSTNERGLNCVLVRFEDLATPTKDSGRNLRELVSALKAASGRVRAPLLVIACPGEESAGCEMLDARMAEELAGCGNLFLITRHQLSSFYPVANYLDSRCDQLGRIPYSETYFTALGTMIARRYHALKRADYKVIVLDCDNTLWTGVCGEEGAAGIVIDEPRRMLQQFMAAKHDAGTLLCICSKNSEADVAAVFDSRKDMVLERGHFIASRVNWRPKSENLRALAQELNLGLDSFIFIDDNPMECAEVQANCPEVLCLQLPEPSRIPVFLNHIWALDHGKVTAEDKLRTVLYRQNRDREQFQRQAPTYADFLESLHLSIQISEMTPEQLPRVAQLTQRTNQFNFTTKRRSEADVRALLDAGMLILTVSVNDRFGDYGLVGVMIYGKRDAAIELDTFLLSCRVLGKGVEHVMLARLGQIACERGVEKVDILIVPSAKNAPAREFLESVAARSPSLVAGEGFYCLSADLAANLRFEPPTQALPELTDVELPGTTEGSSAARRPEAKLFEWIECHAATAAAIQKLIESEPAAPAAVRDKYVAPRTELEQQIGQIWKKLLRREQIGVNDNFFELGGDSLIAVRLFVQIEKLTGKTLPLITLIEAPTIERLAALIQKQGWESEWQSLVPIKASGSKSPLYCVHGVGGNVVGYMDLAKYLEPDQPLYGVQAIGLNGKRPRRNYTVEEMATVYIQEICAFQPRGPYYLGGTSFGGLVAFEMAQQLQKAGEEVAIVALFDTYGPGYPKLLPSTTVWKIRWNRFRTRVDLHWGNLMSADANQRCEYVRHKVSRLKKTTKRVLRSKLLLLKQSVKQGIERRFWPEAIREVNKAGHWAAGDYVPKTYAGSITLFRATEQPRGIHPDPTLGWGPLVRGVEIYDTPGHHGAIVLEPRVKALSGQLTDALGKAQARQQHSTRDVA